MENMSSYSNVHNNRTVAVVLFGTSATLDKNSVAGFCEDKSVDHNSSSGSTTKCATVAAVRSTNILPPGTSTDLHGEDFFGNQSAVIGNFLATVRSKFIAMWFCHRKVTISFKWR
ncbi:hypothetical protein B566_EDAN017964 [Ephemera danica]|nr:hypothetical protein B566_EDAN017964 [Ephemera danica]